MVRHTYRASADVVSEASESGPSQIVMISDIFSTKKTAEPCLRFTPIFVLILFFLAPGPLVPKSLPCGGRDFESRPQSSSCLYISSSRMSEGAQLPTRPGVMVPYLIGMSSRCILVGPGGVFVAIRGASNRGFGAAGSCFGASRTRFPLLRVGATDSLAVPADRDWNLF